MCTVVAKRQRVDAEVRRELFARRVPGRRNDAVDVGDGETRVGDRVVGGAATSARRADAATAHVVGLTDTDDRGATAECRSGNHGAGPYSARAQPTAVRVMAGAVGLRVAVVHRIPERDDHAVVRQHPVAVTELVPVSDTAPGRVHRPVPGIEPVYGASPNANTPPSPPRSQ